MVAHARLQNKPLTRVLVRSQPLRAEPLTAASASFDTSVRSGLAHGKTTLPDLLSMRLADERIVLLDGPLDAQGGARLIAELFQLSADDAQTTSACGSTPLVARWRRCSRSTTPSG